MQLAARVIEHLQGQGLTSAAGYRQRERLARSGQVGGHCKRGGSHRLAGGGYDGHAAVMAGAVLVYLLQAVVELGGRRGSVEGLVAAGLAGGAGGGLRGYSRERAAVEAALHMEGAGVQFLGCGPLQLHAARGLAAGGEAGKRHRQRGHEGAGSGVAVGHAQAVEQQRGGVGTLTQGYRPDVIRGGAASVLVAWAVVSSVWPALSDVELGVCKSDIQ